MTPLLDIRLIVAADDTSQKGWSNVGATFGRHHTIFEGVVSRSKDTQGFGSLA
jgi:hypothetical protein